MLTGQRAFRGNDVSDTLAGILRGEPDWIALPVATPPRIQRLLRRCLEKDSRSRLHDIADARIEISAMPTDWETNRDVFPSRAAAAIKVWLGWPRACLGSPQSRAAS